MSEDQNITTEVLPPIPPFGDVGWSDYILSQLQDDEKDPKGHPLCDGLRRLVEKYIGPITERHIRAVQSPAHQNGIATVIVGLNIKVTNELHPLFGDLVYEENIADCGPYNTDKTYARYQSALAETRAEARALRKLLRIRTVVSEEISEKPQEEIPEGYQSQEDIEKQMNLIDILAQRAGTTSEEVLEKHKIERIKMTKEQSLQVITTLNTMIQQIRENK